MTKAKASEAKAEKVEAPKEASPIITSYKGFDADMKCRGYQFAVGQTYEHNGKVEACSSGFHACDNPWDVLRYYPFVGDDGKFNRFCEVEQGGTLARHGSDSKIASAIITIKAELSLPAFIQRAVDWVIDATKPVAGTVIVGDNKEDGARIGSSGNDARIGSSGDGAQIGSNGNAARIGSSGYAARIGSSGNDARIGSSGNDARIGSSGDDARIGSSGNGARIGSSGDGAQIGSSGYAARIGSSGNGAQIGSSGNDAQITCEGEKAVVASAGRYARVRGKAGAWVSLAEFDGNGDCIGFATGRIGDGGIPADTWLVARGGKLATAERDAA